MATLYWTVASITFAIILSAFLRDSATRKMSGRAWAFIAIATLLWPITLPFILSSKLRALKEKQQASNAAKEEKAKEKEYLKNLQPAQMTGDS